MFLFEKQAKRVEKISIASIQITSRRKDTAKNTADTRNITGFLPVILRVFLLKWHFSALQELGKWGKEDRKFAGINIYPYLCNVKNNNYANIIKHLRLYTEIKNEENRKCLVLRG